MDILQKSMLFFENNPIILHRIKTKLDCDNEHAKEAFLETAKFLDVCKSGNFMVPSLIIDDVWHEFILCTREYQQFCEKIIGAFIHHSPELPSTENISTSVYSNNYRKTVLLLEQYGEINSKFWKTSISEAKCGGAGCGSDITAEVAEAKCGGAGCGSDITAAA